MTGDDQLIIAKSFEIDYKCAKVSNQRSKNRCHKCLAWLLPTAHVRSLPVRSRVNALPADNKFWFDEKIMKICWFEKSFDSKKKWSKCLICWDLAKLSELLLDDWSRIYFPTYEGSPASTLFKTINNVVFSKVSTRNFLTVSYLEIRVFESKVWFIKFWGQKRTRRVSYRALLRWVWSSRCSFLTCSLASSRSRCSLLLRPETRAVSSSASSAWRFAARKREFNFST